MHTVPEAVQGDLNMVDHRDVADDRPGCDDRFCLCIDNGGWCMPVPAQSIEDIRAYRRTLAIGKGKDFPLNA